MQASPAEQATLLQLAEIDTAIEQAGHRRATLPELDRLKTLGGQRNAVTAELVESQTALGDLEADQQRLESDLEPARARLVRNQAKVDAGEVSDPKALRSMVDEIEHLKGRITKLEDDELELMQRVEDATARRDEIAARRGVIDDEARGLIAARDASLAEIDADTTRLRADREAVAQQVPAPLRAVYDKIAQRVGSGAARLADGRCLGCHVQANAADLRGYQSAPVDQVVRCEECGRILVR